MELELESPYELAFPRYEDVNSRIEYSGGGDAIIYRLDIDYAVGVTSEDLEAMIKDFSWYTLPDVLVFYEDGYEHSLPSSAVLSTLYDMKRPEGVFDSSRP